MTPRDLTRAINAAYLDEAKTEIIRPVGLEDTDAIPCCDREAWAALRHVHATPTQNERGRRDVLAHRV